MIGKRKVIDDKWIDFKLYLNFSKMLSIGWRVFVVGFSKAVNCKPFPNALRKAHSTANHFDRL